MNIIVLRGRMGNQMFQYALYLSFKYKGIDVCIDDNGSDSDLVVNFGINYKRLNLFRSLLRKVVRAVFYITGDCHLPFRYTDKELGYDPIVFELRWAYIFGYWQNERYFEDEEVKRRLRDDFSCPKVLKEHNCFSNWLRKVEFSNSVAVHFRRTDYLTENVNGNYLYKDICTDDYYKKAIDFILDKVLDATFYVFSDDKDFARIYVHDNLEKIGSFVVVDDDLSDLEEFYIMSACKHIILANSTFSWWAAWLNPNPDSIQIAPVPWVNMYDYSDIYTGRMIKISGDK